MTGNFRKTCKAKAGSLEFPTNSFDALSGINSDVELSGMEGVTELGISVEFRSHFGFEILLGYFHPWRTTKPARLASTVFFFSLYVLSYCLEAHETTVLKKHQHSIQLFSLQG